MEPTDTVTDVKARAALYTALAKAQGEFKPIEKNKTVTIKPREKPQYTFSYADLEELIAKTRPALTANGLAVSQQLHEGKLVTQLLHAEGGLITSEIGVPRADGEPKSYGALLTYLRRYAYSALLCLAADDDLDEDGQHGDNDQHGDDPQGGRQQRPTRQEPKARPTKPAAEGGKLASGAQLKWAKERLATLDQDVGIRLLEKHGLKSLDTELTAEAFDALKKALLA